MENNYKRTLAGTVGAGMGTIFNASGRRFYILEHKTESKYHHAGESQKIIVDQIELGRDSSCQVRFDESFETVSRRHAAIVRDGENWKLISLSQTNATLVNGQAITGEWHLNSGDEIRLSSRGPVMGFIVPQGKQSMVNSIGLTERMNLFRKQALRPYKTAITLLAILLVLAVAGLVAWNLYQAKQYEEKLADTHAQIEATTAEIVSKDAEIEELVNRIEANKDASEQELEATKQALAAARAAQRNLINQHSALQEDLNAIKKEMQGESEPETIAVAEENAEEVAVEEKPAEEKKTFFANVEDCLDAVYYIKMNDLAVYDKDTNMEIIRFNTNNIEGGTGFMLNDGRFVTANRTIEPWYHFGDTKLGKANGRDWTLEDVLYEVQVKKNKVVANFTAYSRSGNNFNFKNTDMTCRVWKESDKVYLREASFGNIGKIDKLYYRDNTPKYDWATMAKRDQLSVVKGLEFSNDASIMPKATTEVIILGFPRGGGFTDSHTVNPISLTNNINVTGLNDESIIELSSRRYKPGNDGAPVLQMIDGKWTVIGILCHTDSADRDNVVPIINTIK